MTITCKIIAHSITESGQEIITGEWVYPRIVLAEINTHRVFSRNSASSRAIPVTKMNDSIRSDIARPVRFGKANPGMQDAGDHDALINGYTPHEWWDLAIYSAIQFSQAFDEAGYAKQVCNRLTEAGSHMKTVVTSTDFDNWDWLRDHDAADPTIAAVARAWTEARKDSKPVVLEPGEWHTPYYQDGFWSPCFDVNETGEEITTDKYRFTLDQALAISSSCCAQVSFRTTDDSLEKAMRVKAQLIKDNATHGSPFEHQATPIESARPSWLADTAMWPKGVTHMNRDFKFCSGNFVGWIQHRQLIPGHDYASTQLG